MRPDFLLRHAQPHLALLSSPGVTKVGAPMALLPRFSSPFGGFPAVATLLVALSCSALVGCGRSATEADCEQILEKAARLEMEERLGKPDEKLVASEVAATKKSMRDAMMKQCVGKRITDSALECVKNAKTSKELTEDCFR